MNQLTILNYHGIDGGSDTWDEGQQGYVVSRSDFATQLTRIQKASFVTLDQSELTDWLGNSRQIENPIVLTFDDGLLSHYEQAWGELQSRGMKGIFFISASLVGKPGYVNWEQLKEMVNSGSCEVGSHGMNHVPLTGLSEAELKKEIIESKTVIEDQLNIKVKSFSVPRGYYHPKFKSVAAEAGYDLMYTSNFDVNRIGDDKYSLCRVAILKTTNMDTFTSYIKGEFGAKVYVEKAKSMLRQVVPAPLYDFAARVKGRMVGAS